MAEAQRRHGIEADIGAQAAAERAADTREPSQQDRDAESADHDHHVVVAVARGLPCGAAAREDHRRVADGLSDGEND